MSWLSNVRSLHGLSGPLAPGEKFNENSGRAFLEANNLWPTHDGGGKPLSSDAYVAAALWYPKAGVMVVRIINGKPTGAQVLLTLHPGAVQVWKNQLQYGVYEKDTGTYKPPPDTVTSAASKGKPVSAYDASVAKGVIGKAIDDIFGGAKKPPPGMKVPDGTGGERDWRPGDPVPSASGTATGGGVQPYGLSPGSPGFEEAGLSGGMIALIAVGGVVLVGGLIYALTRK